MSIDAFLNDDHKMFKDIVDNIVEKECSKEHVRELDEKKLFPYTFYSKFPELGWFGLTLPEEYGGSNCDPVYYCILMETLGKYSFDIASGYSLVMWGATALVRFGTEEQKQYYLPRIVEGKNRCSLSITEPNSGSDASSITTFAASDGDDFIVNGQKVFSTAADAKDNIIFMAARTDKNVPKHKGISVIMIPNDTPGVELIRLNTLSRRILGTNEVFLTDVRIPKENLVGTINGGWDIITSLLQLERTGIASAFVGNSQTAVNDALRYAKERKQFGRAIGDFQAIQHMLADMQMNVDAARLMVYRTAWLEKEGRPCATEASMAKLFASETYQMVTGKGMQILGGYSQMAEYNMERYFRDAKQSTISGGTSEIQRLLIAKGLGL